MVGLLYLAGTGNRFNVSSRPIAVNKVYHLNFSVGIPAVMMSEDYIFYH